MPSGKVRGVLFIDYVRMIRGRKDVDWSRLLPPEDLAFVASRLEPNAWYPLASFERMGNAIFREIAGGSFAAVEAWGEYSVEAVCRAEPDLLAPGDPVETLMRFRVQRSTYFDFESLVIPSITTDHAEIVIRYGMGPAAEEAASHQTLGFFRGLLAAAGATEIRARFLERAWAGDPETLLDLEWRAP